jgi:hypothetical protein
MRGHIRKRGQNSWEIKFEVERTDGKRQTRYKSFKGTRREAHAELSRLLVQAQTGGFVDPINSPSPNTPAPASRTGAPPASSGPRVPNDIVSWSSTS